MIFALDMSEIAKVGGCICIFTLSCSNSLRSHFTKDLVLVFDFGRVQRNFETFFPQAVLFSHMLVLDGPIHSCLSDDMHCISCMYGQNIYQKH